MLNLIFHYSTPCFAVQSLQCTSVFTPDANLTLQYILRGDLDKLIIPSLQSPKPVDSLWKHTCFEAFICVQGESRYYEYNFSPSTQWAAYAFDGYRDRITWAASHTPTIHTEQTDDQLLLEATIADSDLPPNPNNKTYQLALTAVIESAGGSKSYWALTHPADTPDFHHQNGFTHEIWS